MKGTLDYGLELTDEEKYRAEKTRSCRICKDPITNKSQSGLCSMCHNTVLVPLRNNFIKIAAEWDTHYNELQAGLDALECPACGHEMRLWRVDDEVAWRCKRRWREDNVLMMCSEVVELDD